MKPQPIIEVTLDEYMGMFRAVESLYALEGAGVDNWAGYEEVDWGSVDEACQKEEDSRNV